MFNNDFLSQVEGYKSLYVNRDSQIDYSDGEVESYILQVLNECQNKGNQSYTEWEKYIKDWPTEYHFSWVRTNVLAPVTFNSNQRVLELGCGTGILTHYIAPQVSEVTCIEGSLLRGKCNAKRCESFDNVNIVISNFEDLDFIKLFGEHSFDVITLIGVLEYTNKYFTSKDGISTLLQTINQLLKPEGCLVLAIENKLGLKYLLGWEEDHNNTVFYGIEDRYKTKDVITFSYDELNKLLEKCSFPRQTYLFPFPDYKLPKIIFSSKHEDQSITGERNLYNNLLQNIEFRNYSRNPPPLVEASRVLKNVVSSSLLKHLSNSFLVVCQKNGSEKIIPTNSNILAYYFSSDRKFEYANRITFTKNVCQIDFKKERLFNDKSINSREDILSLNESHFEKGRITDGRLLESFFEDCFIKSDKKAFIYNLSLWSKFLNKEISNFKNTEFDLMPLNIVVNNENEFIVIDKAEWTCKFSLSTEQILARYLMLNSKYLFWLTNNSGNTIGLINLLLQSLSLNAVSQQQLDVVQIINDYTVSNIKIASYPKHEYSNESLKRKLINEVKKRTKTFLRKNKNK